MLILSWNIERMFNMLNALIDNKDDSLIELFGRDNWDKLLVESNGNKAEAMGWIKHVCKSNVNNTRQLLLEIKKLTKGNPDVQKRLKAVGL